MTSAEKALLNTIAWAEGTAQNPLTKCDGYDVIVSGPEGPEVFTDFAHHPFWNRRPKLVRQNPHPLYSTAAGRYQLLYRYWVPYKASLGLLDYSPASQDAVALQQAKECGGLALLEKGSIADALKQCGTIWASLPESPYGQPTRTMEEALTVYVTALGGDDAANVA